MLSDPLPLILGILSVALLLGAVLMWTLRRRRIDSKPLPTEWTLTARPVFNADERRVYRQLRDALPHHIVLSKLPLVRFCQPSDPQQVRYWYELLGAIHVGFAICSPNGRVLAAIDIDNERTSQRRSMHIKQKVLAACRVRYLRCPVDHLPSIPELQLLVPQSMTQARGPHAAPAAPVVQEAASGRDRRREHKALWQDSGFFQDSFFGVENRNSDFGAPSEFSGFMRGMSVREMPGERASGDEVAGVVAGAGRTPPVRH
jgi:hypothetical protein